MKRLFAAFDILPAEDLKAAYAVIRHSLRFERIKWVQDDLFHITLKFLGDTDEKQIPVIIELLENLIGPFSSFEVVIKGAGVFKNLKEPRVIWFGCIPSDSIPLQLKQQLESHLTPLGFEPEVRPFFPHLTLGRVKQIEQTSLLSGLLTDYCEKVFMKQEIRNIVLYESRLTPSGSRYIPLRTFVLNGTTVARFQS